MRSVFLDFIQRRALDNWASTGWDDTCGSSFEALDSHGEPLRKLDKRTRVQLRQIYVYSHAHALGLCDGADFVRNVFDFLERGALAAETGGCAHMLSRDGDVLDSQRDLYDQAFLLLACAWSHKAFRQERPLQIAYATQAFLDTSLKAANGGWYESSLQTGNAAGERRQNPHMHLFEAYLALYEVTGDARWRALADQVLSLFERVFYDPETECLFEYFNADWTPAGEPRQQIEPGHMLEWSWLLDQYRRLTGADTRAACVSLMNTALAHGLNRQTGLIYDALSVRLEPKQATHRTWPQAEYIKALIVAAERGDVGAEAALDDAVCALTKHVVSPQDQSIWIDRVDAFGEPVRSDAPASTFYHLFSAAAEYSRFFANKTAAAKARREAQMEEARQSV